jgi:hypothetical protein
MAKRPTLTEQSFLSHVFSPKKHAAPSGLRKTTLTGLKGGRSKARLNAYNKTSAVNQEILKRSGLRDAYLKGQTTLAEAKRSLRGTAISLGVAKPMRARARRAAQAPRETKLDRMIRTRFVTEVRDAGKDVNEGTVDSEFVWLDNGTGEMTTWSYSKFKYAGRKGSEYERIDAESRIHNPFWYH